MSALTDYLVWEASLSANKASTVPTKYEPMSAAAFQENHDGSVDAMNRRALDSSNNVILRTWLDVATSLRRVPRDTNKD